MDLGSLQGEGALGEVGVGWIGKEWGNQLTWLNLSGNEELGGGGGVEGFWDGFGLLRELIGESTELERRKGEGREGELAS